MKKIFVVDDKITKDDSNKLINIFKSTIIDIVVLGFIELGFTIIWEVNLRYHNRLANLLLIFPLCFVLLKFFYKILKGNISKDIVANQNPYVILYDKKMLILSNVGVVEPTIAITCGSQLINDENLLKSLNNLGFTIAGHDEMNNDINEEVDINEVINVINSEVVGRYNIVIYENVSFEKETKNNYVFKGNILSKDGSYKGEQRFNLMKIYKNYEELKKVK